jgi:hypothetical protein
MASLPRTTISEIAGNNSHTKKMIVTATTIPVRRPSRADLHQG